MALKVKATEQLIKIGKYEGKYRYVMMPELYTALAQEKVIKEAAMRSGVNRGVMQACWDAAGEVIKAWATEGHSVALPGLGTMRFGLRAKSVEKVEDVVNIGDELEVKVNEIDAQGRINLIRNDIAYENTAPARREGGNRRPPCRESH